ncbi:MAG: hypothetical protein DBY16_02435 [Coprobacter sp.]|nr:MAG: hypothetical protein DBY16_02435 [Coprobacter sp.]
MIIINGINKNERIMKANSFKIKEIKIKSSKPSSVKIVSDKEVAAEVVRLNPDKNSMDDNRG